MKKSYENFALFINEQKTYFNEFLSSSSGLSWDDNHWAFSPEGTGFLTFSGKAELVFNEFNTKPAKAVFDKDETIIDQVIKIDTTYQNFMKAYLVYVIKLSTKIPSGSTLRNRQLLLKRIYVRLLFSGLDPHPTNIHSELIQKATDLLATSRPRQSNAADDYTAMNRIIKDLNYLEITKAYLEFEIKIRKSSSKSTKSAKNAKDKAFKDKHFAEDFGDDDNEKLITIHSFLNIISLRAMLQTPYEQIILNLVLLLIITGMRYHEAATLKFDSLKRLDIEDEAVKKILAKRKLPPYYLGIRYQGEKGVGQRIHWIEPLAIPLVEFIFNDTLEKSVQLRQHIKTIRENGFKSLLPNSLLSLKEKNKMMPPRLMELDDVIEHIYESLASSSNGLNRSSRSSKRDSTKKRLKKRGIEPFKSIKNNNGFDVYYSFEDIEHYLRKELKADKQVSNDFIRNIRDTKNNFEYSILYEELLFLIPIGSSSIKRTGVIKPLPQYIGYSDMAKFLGSGPNVKYSIFAKYNLTDETGEFTQLTTHIPRHNINTFLAIAEVSEHLQAMMMGRVDIEQNKHYQHLAIEEKLSATNMVSVAEKQPTTCSINNAIDIIKDSTSIKLNPNLELGKAIAQNTHTHTTQHDKSSFINDVMDATDAELFLEFEEQFGEIETTEKKALIDTHSDLMPVTIGSCMRKLTSFQCPYNIKCQDGSSCPYFTLTGRADELTKVKSLINSIKSEITLINQLEMNDYLTFEDARDILEELELRRDNLRALITQSTALEQSKVTINLLELDGYKKPKTLASLFAIEHQNLKKHRLEKKRNNNDSKR
ncbi:hypothetical protein [Aliivibrio fischeri]|uniref:hypothetical protein n=1 Tax=Aliivibrio fischeri TaxID=668 RepID=UPI0012DA5488|nr:hypothetical protein [Aliivibrio fischeri]MUL16274.1 hypothetical protein [Aliivibrio fischeri]